MESGRKALDVDDNSSQAHKWFVALEMFFLSRTNQKCLGLYKTKAALNGAKNGFIHDFVKVENFQFRQTVRNFFYYPFTSFHG